MTGDIPVDRMTISPFLNLRERKFALDYADTFIVTWFCVGVMQACLDRTVADAREL
jgi:hypothetical protein